MRERPSAPKARLTQRRRIIKRSPPDGSNRLGRTWNSIESDVDAESDIGPAVETVVWIDSIQGNPKGQID